MSIPPPSTNPPVNIKCASHVRYLVKDLDESLKFYTEVLGFVVSDQHAKVVYLRGIEESCRHSVVLMQTDGEPTAGCLGIRVASKEDIHRHTNSCGPMVGPQNTSTAPSSRSLLSTFASGAPPIELCSSVPIVPRL